MAKRFPKTALLVPAYNDAETIFETLDSVQRQKALSLVEMVYLADDCSTDDTLSVAKRAWRSSVPLTIIARTQNLGEYTNVNSAIRDMPEDVEWVCILHADDIAKDPWLRMITDQIADCDSEMASICSSWDNLFPNGKIHHGENAPSRDPQVIRGTYPAVRDTVMSGCWWHISGCAIRRQVFLKLGGLPEEVRSRGDFELLLRCLSTGWSITYIPLTLIIYRNRLDNVSGSALRSHLDVIRSLQIAKRYLSYLTWNDIVSLHCALLWRLSRRLTASILRGDSRRALSACRMSLKVWWNLGLAMVSRIRPADDHSQCVQKVHVSTRHADHVD